MAVQQVCGRSEHEAQAGKEAGISVLKVQKDDYDGNHHNTAERYFVREVQNPHVSYLRLA